MPTPVTIDIVSDVMCPWCYIGKKRLEKALGSLDDSIPVDVRWRPFQLAPTLPPEGKDRRQYLSEKFGGDGRAAKIYQAVREAGQYEGIAFDFEAIGKAPNTLDSHRLIRWAASGGEGAQDRVVTRLFQLYFEEGADLTDRRVLLDAARDAGLDASIVEALLAGDSDREAVQAEIAMASRMGVTGVPCFILNGKYAVMGAQDAGILADAIRQVSDAPARGVGTDG